MPVSRRHISILTGAAVTTLVAWATIVFGQENGKFGSGHDSAQDKLHASGLILRGPLALSMTAESAQRDADVCRAWSYKELPLKQHVLSMQQVSAADWGRHCYQYACSVKGEAEVEGVKYRIEVNAGGWVSLVAPDGATRYWASSKKLPGFLAACDCCE